MMRTVLRSLVHNVIAHPLLFWGDLGDWLHDVTAPPDGDYESDRDEFLDRAVATESDPF